MFKIESYVTPILLSYVDKYVRDFKPADAQVSLWGGGVALHNLVLKADVLQQEVALPFTLVSGRIHELLIQVPWTKIMSEPIVVTIDTIECVLSLNPPATADESPSPESPSQRAAVIEAPPGYMQALVRRVVSNIALRVHHLIVKYVEDDIVLSLNVKHLAVDSAGPSWEPAFADIEQAQPVIRRLMRLDDLTLCLDRADADGKIRYFQEPLLYRCQLDFRILTRLVSANTRRASRLSIQLCSSKLAWGVTSDQLALLLRLFTERTAVKPPTPAPKTTQVQQSSQLNVSVTSSAEPARSESWSEWAWSWLPTWAEREGADAAAAGPAPLPTHFAAYFDEVSLVFKVMKTEGNSRKRARPVLELSASLAAIKGFVCKPTTVSVRMGTRDITLASKGKCVCGHLDYNAINDEPTIYLYKKEKEEPEVPWTWPEDYLAEAVEPAQAVDEEYRATPEPEESIKVDQSDHGQPEEPVPEDSVPREQKEDIDDFWQKMAPLFYLEYSLERSPPTPYTNPYDNPPLNFQYSDWVEECSTKVQIEPVEVRVCMGLVHRLEALKDVFNDLEPIPEPDLPMRTLTVEECEALMDNLPERRISIESRGLHVRVIPWDHSLSQRPKRPPLVLELDLPKSSVVLNGPLYPHRVCSAACQMPDDTGALWQGARLHVTVNLSSIQAQICCLETQARPCARLDVRAVAHLLLNKKYFTQRESVIYGYSLKIGEANVCGSSARLQAAWRVAASLLQRRACPALRNTSLPTDALNDEEMVAIDLTLEDLNLRGYITNNIKTHILTLQSAKATALHEPKGEELKQAWLFSAPDAPSNTPYIRAALQWCAEPVDNSLDYAGMWTEPTAIAVDPLFIAWLAYAPTPRVHESFSSLGSLKSTSSQYIFRRRSTPPSSSGRGASKSGSAPELIHVHPRSLDSSEKADAKRSVDPQQPKKNWLSGERLLALHERLRQMLMNVEIGLTVMYVTMSTASAVDCATVRDAMERHASEAHRVLALSLGRLSMNSATITRQFWPDIRHDGPTFIATKPTDTQIAESFPWKMRYADVSCYILEVRLGADQFGRDRSATGLRSQLKTPLIATPTTVLELVTTTVTLSVVTKTILYKTMPKAEKVKKRPEPTADEKRLKYFTAGQDFKPTTLKEFVRGPAKRQKQKKTPDQAEKKAEPTPILSAGPVVSLGVHLHADTPPLKIRMDHDQVHTVSAAAHCFTHIVALLKRQPTYSSQYSQAMLSDPSPIRSASEIGEIRSPSDESSSDTKSELISIYESKTANDMSIDIKTFFWFQWVVSHVTLVMVTHQVQLAFDIDDIISTVDLQSHYNQLKVKVASASVRHYERTGSDEWTAGVLGGRVLEAREPTNAKEENHFLAITITQSQISNLPTSWREELHPKLLEQESNTDNMWEIYATLAPLEAIIQPRILEQVVFLVLEMAPRSFCPLQKDTSQGVSSWQWPFCYVTAGGLRLLVTCEDYSQRADDTFMFVIGKVTVNPHPENPICRRAINSGVESSWLTTNPGLEGRQYEIIVKSAAIRSAQFSQLVDQEASETDATGTAGENPALKWTQPVVAPNITPVLHAVDIGCVLAPAYYVNEVLTCGPAIELNLVSDCAIELSLEQLILAQTIVDNFQTAVKEREDESTLFDEEKHGVCPYATLLMSTEPEEIVPTVDSATLIEDSVSREIGRSSTNDSGVDTVTTTAIKYGRHYEESERALGSKKSVSIAVVEHLGDASDYIEVFVTMGMIELSLYVEDDGSPAVVALRPPSDWKKTTAPEPTKVFTEESKPTSAAADDNASLVGSKTKSLTEQIRTTDAGKMKLDKITIFQHARKIQGNLPLIHVTLHQPNLYYWRKKTQKTIQVSLFNAWLGLGGGQVPEYWHAALASTAKGVADPVTDIPPALATVKLMVPASEPDRPWFAGAAGGGGAPRGSVRVDVERPVLLEVSTDRLRRLKAIAQLLKDNNILQPGKEPDPPVKREPSPLYRLRRVLVKQSIETITVQTSQIGLSGSEGALGWDSLSLQVAAGARPDRLCARALVSAASLAAGPPGDARHVVLQPTMAGVELEASWEAWRRAEGGPSAKEPAVRVSFEVDRVTMDLRPAELEAATRMRDTLREILKIYEPTPEQVQIRGEWPTPSKDQFTKQSSVAFDLHLPVSSVDNGDDHHYKDDLRSGAFKIVSGGQLPMAYQVTLYNNAVSWRYPHPRAITRLVAFPLPGQDLETPCVLEHYDPVLCRWEAQAHFSVPVDEPREMQLYLPPPDSVFAVMWRFRVFRDEKDQYSSYEFDIKKFMPRPDPLVHETPPDPPLPKSACGVTAEQLSGVVRVDSCFSPRVSPRARVVTRVANLDIHLHNALPAISSQSTSLEGYYVSKPLMRSHRVLTLSARDATAHAHFASPAGALLLLNTNLSSDIVDCATGTMEQLVDEFRLRAGVSLPAGGRARARVAASRVHAALHVPRARTLNALAMDWRKAAGQYTQNSSTNEPGTTEGRRESADVTAEALEGRVALWIHNTCATALRVGQEGTDEVVPLGPGARLAYRWHCPTAAKTLRFALAGPSTDWHWSSNISFTPGTYRIRLEDAEALSSSKSAPSAGVYLHAKVEESGARRSIHLSGRLCLANMLRFNLLYKVRVRCPVTNQWRTLCSGEMSPETIGKSVICGADCEMALKIKFPVHDIGWSGDIPLKECPKENVPWLVKVPSEGDSPYMSVWCRVVRARSDGRILATVWPLYVLYSHLPLDIDVLIVTESGASNTDVTNPAPLIQSAPGRGSSTHLLAPGTTAARHLLTFQYRHVECLVTRESVPLHYGVTDTSVFDKRAPVASLDEVLADTHQWLERSGRHADSQWPYSVVTSHWPGRWLPASLQPRCDVTMRYQAVRAGGGCSLEVQICPLVLLCNATPIALTLRAHDAAPLCKLEPGTALSPPTAVLQKPFFISVEMGRETFVSGELALCGAELGRYGKPPAGRVALDAAADFAVHCNHKVALLTMYYEIKEGINILGMTSTHVLINRLNTNILVSAMAVPSEAEEDLMLRPSTYKDVEPTEEGSIHGTPLCRFWVVDRWRGTDPAGLRLYLCLALPGGAAGARASPVRLGQPPVRHALALTDANNTSVPVVVTKLRHQGRWVVTVADDPCPQLAVHNRTRAPLAVAQPRPRPDTEPSTSRVAVLPDCPGTRWHCVVQPETMVHYSTPEHCLRYPPPANAAPPRPAVTFLTFAKSRVDEYEPEWCAPVAAADGEQLVQLGGGVTVKLRVRTHPHSTLVEIRDVDHHDISAMDIRRRLHRMFSPGGIIQTLADDDLPQPQDLQRVAGDDKLREASPDKLTTSLLAATPSQDNTATLVPNQVVVDDNRLAGNQPEDGGYQPVGNQPGSSQNDDGDDKQTGERKVPSTMVLYSESTSENIGAQQQSRRALQRASVDSDEAASVLRDVSDPEWEETASWGACDRLRFMAQAVAVELAAAADARPLVAVHLDRAAILVRADSRRTKTTISIADVQIDNLQYESGQYDFAVVATTRGEALAREPWPTLWNLFGDNEAFAARQREARALLRLTHDSWTVANYTYTELAEVEVRLGPLALYVEDAYVSALAALARGAAPPAAPAEPAALEAEWRVLLRPLRLRALCVHPLDLTLTLHTAVRMYIALDQSPLRLSAFALHDMMTSTERLTHAVTVHYLSAAILGAGWVVGGLELLGAPGALAARVGGATGGVRGVASAAAAALLRSLSAWAGSLARNLDLLAGDEEHSRRAAAARRRPPPSLIAGLATGITNFAINILGAVGGLAHHPLVGVAVGESESGATALRRGLIGALAKPLSATADLVAYAGHGLLSQTGWDPVPQPRCEWLASARLGGGWRRDCVRWSFRLADLTALAGFHVLLDGAALQLLLTHKYLVVADADSERIVEMIEFRFCSIGPYQGQIIELCVKQRRTSKLVESRAVDEDDEYQISAQAMARVARYTGAEGAGAGAGGGGAAGAASGESRLLSLLPAPGQAVALHAALTAAAHHNSDSHFPLL